VANNRWQAGAVIRKKLSDGSFYYACLLEFPWVAFYHHRSRLPEDDLVAITKRPVIFTIAAHKDLLAKDQWQTIGHVPVDGSLQPPAAQAIWDDPDNCQIIDAEGDMRPATPEECAGLEPAAVWEPEHIDDRLRDAFAGRPNRWLDEMIPKRS
jgi:Immunity protein 26